jgi:foldase protein PrsA
MFLNKNVGQLILACMLVFALMPVVVLGYGKQEASVVKYAGDKEITESQYKNYLDVIKMIEPSMEPAIDAGDKEENIPATIVKG